jgi:hypothetical protein
VGRRGGNEAVAGETSTEQPVTEWPWQRYQHQHQHQLSISISIGRYGGSVTAQAWRVVRQAVYNDITLHGAGVDRSAA